MHLVNFVGRKGGLGSGMGRFGVRRGRFRGANCLNGELSLFLEKLFPVETLLVHRLNAFSQFCRPKGGFGVRNGPIRGPEGPVSGSKLTKWSALSLFGKTFSSGDPSVHRLNAFSQFCRPKGGFGVRNGPIRGPEGPVSGSKLTKWSALSLFGKTFSSGDPSVHRLNAFQPCSATMSKVPDVPIVSERSVPGVHFSEMTVVAAEETSYVFPEMTT
jgi:hypothetical protein